MLSKRFPLAVLCAVAMAVACDAADSVTGPSAGANPSLLPVIETEFLPGVPVLDPFSHVWDDDAGVIESARGGGHWETGTGLRTFAFTAKNRADGTVQGQYQINNRDVSGAREHGEVTCLAVDGDQAWIGGVITHSSLPDRVGMRRVFQVIDRGEGSGEPPDEASILILVFTPDACQTRPFLAPRALEGGNLQVRDGA